MKRSKHYAKNLEKYARDNPVEARRLDQVDCSKLEFCLTYLGELNVVDNRGEHPVYLHAQEGAEPEADFWAKNLSLGSVDALFVYGIGLGYYYIRLKEWLKKDPKRVLVFLEDDPAIINCFLNTELAQEILDCPQVILKQVPKAFLEYQEWPEGFDFAVAFSRLRSQLTCLMSYFIFRFDQFSCLLARWPVLLGDAYQNVGNLIANPHPKYRNFYANLPLISEAAIGSEMKGELSGIPAVLCGAGPSLVKQLPLVSKLNSKALIMASGSAINAVTQAGIIPHVAGAIDPTEVQASRMLTSFAFDVPAFYQNTFYDKALAQWHGPLIYLLKERSVVHFVEWFENRLGIGKGTPVPAGESTSNFLTAAAAYLDCTPVVMIGMDLAYTEGKRYAKGVSVHPTDEKKQHEALEAKEGTLPVKGLGGKDVYTTMHWCYEAGAFINLKKNSPSTEILNATEGGMPILTIENVTFSDAVERHFLDSWEIGGWLHGAIVNAAGHVSEAKAIEVLKEWKSGLQRCGEWLKRILKESPGKAALWQEKLYEEDVYVYFLKTMDEVYTVITALDRRSWKFIQGQSRRLRAERKYELNRWKFLQGYVRQHLKDIRAGMAAYAAFRKALRKPAKKRVVLEKKVEPPEYRTSNGRLKIVEKDLGVSVDIAFSPQLVPKAKKVKGDFPKFVACEHNGKREGQMLCYYPDGSIKAEAFYHQGKLHGPWTFFGKSGKILYRSWYVEGRKLGRCASYYGSGDLYHVSGYRDDALQGEYLSYYPNGQLRTSAFYRNGQLDGTVRLYYPNGVLKKEQHFVKGVLDGMERLWAPSGVQVIEAEYHQGRPVGISRRWDETGKLVSTIKHDERKAVSQES